MPKVRQINHLPHTYVCFCLFILLGQFHQLIQEVSIMFTTGFAVFLALLLIMVKLPRRWMLRLLHHDLLVDIAVSVLVMFLHWGSFEGIMAATIAGLLTSVATSSAKKLFGHISGNLYFPGFINLSLEG